MIPIWQEWLGDTMAWSAVVLVYVGRWAAALLYWVEDKALPARATQWSPLDEQAPWQYLD